MVLKGEGGVRIRGNCAKTQLTWEKPDQERQNKELAWDGLDMAQIQSS